MKSTRNRPMLAVKKTLDLTMIIVFALLATGAVFTLLISENIYVRGALFMVLGVMIVLHLFRQSADEMSSF